MPGYATDGGADGGHPPFIPWEAEVFFQGFPRERMLYGKFAALLERLVPDARLNVRRTQLSFFLNTMFLAVWLLPRKNKKPRIIVALSLGRAVESDRVMASSRVSTSRWTVHIPLESEENLDKEMEGWILEAAEKAKGR